jgi:ParB/RepB/Spo0J family partition protein
MAARILIKGENMTITNSETGNGIRALTFEQLRVSTTQSQTERRKHFDKAALAELADSIKKVGVLSPIIVRQVNGHFEVVAGERRLIAAKDAGLAAISVDVRAFTDEQVIEIQLIENLQREGLHPLSEAEGYEALMKLGHSADEVAEKLGKTKSYIYARIKLLALSADARKAFYEGKFPPSSALLLARIPMPVQLEALKEIISNPYDDAPMSFREVRRLIHETYMLRLAEAPFPTGDVNLVPEAGTCGACPKRTGNQPELFEDVKGKDLCTDPGCFKMKREAWAKLQVVQAKEAGREVITGAEAKKIAAYGDQSFARGYARLDAKCWDDPKHRTYKQILGKEARPVLVQLPKGGDLIELVQTNDAIKKLRADGVIKPSKPVGGSGQVKRSNPAEDAAEQALHGLLFSAIHAKAPRKLTRDVLERLVEHEMDAVCGDLPQMFFTAWGWDADNYSFDKLTESQLHQLLFEILLAGELSPDAAVQTVQLTKVAKSLGVDVKKVRADAAKLTGAAAAKPAKKAKGKKR